MEPIDHIEIGGDHASLRGTNKKAEMVARMSVNTDYSVDEVMVHYRLSAAEVHAAIAYFYDNQSELDAHHQDAIRWASVRAFSLAQFIE